MSPLGPWFRRARLEERLDAELRDHFERQVADYVRAGIPIDEARRRTRLEFGGLEQVKEECRDVRTAAWLEALVRDTRFALRGLVRSPRFSITAILTLALAIGGAAAVFSVVDRSLFRPLPYAAEDRLVSVGIVGPLISPEDWLFVGAYRDWREAAPSFESIAAWTTSRGCDVTDGAPQRLLCGQAEAGFLTTLGVSPVVGRNLSAEEDVVGADPVALISHGLWMGRFGGSEEILERRISIDGFRTRIVGVLPPGFELPNLAPADILLPLKLAKTRQRQRVVQVVGRLRPGLDPATAQARLEPHFARFVDSLPGNVRETIAMQFRVLSLRDLQTLDSRTALLLLLGAALSFVLIACANVASLLLARSASRSLELDVRMWLGASRTRLAQQAFTEAAVLGSAGGVAGCMLAWLFLRGFQLLAPDAALRMMQASLDLRALLFVAFLTLVATIFFGLAPIWTHFRQRTFGAARVVGDPRGWLRPVLVCGQLVLSVVLLSTTGLLLVSLFRLQQVQLGFAPESVVTASFVLPAVRYETLDRQLTFFHDLHQQLGEIPGAISAAISDTVPPGGDPRSFPAVSLLGGGDVREPGQEGLVKWRYVSTGYFRTLGIPILNGRVFADEDRTGAPQRVVISESLAARLLPGVDPVGEIIRFLRRPARVVGVAADVLNSGLRAEPNPEIYALRNATPNHVTRNQRRGYGWRAAVAALRSTREAADAAEALQETIQQADPTLAVVTGTLSDQVHQHLARPRFQTALLSLFAMIGLALAAVGLYGLTSFLAAARTREIGVRIALGATRTRVVRLLMAGGLWLIVVGVGVGSALALGVAQTLRAVLFEVSPWDVRVFAASAAVLALVAVLGTWIPSARAARMDPTTALRHE